MSDIKQLRLARWERIQKGGILRFIATRGLIFAVFFGVMVFISSPLPWYLSLLVSCVAGLVWATVMWFFTMWQFSQARKKS
jgi:hypothetical protein